MSGDGGGKAPALARPAIGRESVARFLLGLARQVARFDLDVRVTEVNGEAGAVIRHPAGRVVTVMAPEIADGSVQAIRSVVNPDKLRHLGPVANFVDLLRARRDQPDLG